MTKVSIKFNIEKALILLEEPDFWERKNEIKNLLNAALKVTIYTTSKIRAHHNPAQLEFVDVVKNAVVIHCGVPAGVFQSKVRAANFVMARHIAMWILRDMFEYSLKDIGEQFKLDHCSVLHGCRKINNYIAHDDRFKKELYQLKNKINFIVNDDGN